MQFNGPKFRNVPLAANRCWLAYTCDRRDRRDNRPVSSWQNTFQTGIGSECEADDPCAGRT